MNGAKRMPQRVACYFRARPLLLFLLAADLVFVAIHVWFWSRGNLPWDFNLGRAGSYAEKFQYLKWFASSLLCAWAFARQRDALYLAWAALFLYLLLDDSLEIHESLGPLVAQSLDRGPAYGLRGKDFGEIVVSLGAATLLLGLIACCYWRSRNAVARALTLALVPWLAMLAFFGIAMDMAKRQMRVFYGEEFPTLVADILEDGGEMIAASFLTAIVAHAVLRFGADDGRENPKGVPE